MFKKPLIILLLFFFVLGQRASVALAQGSEEIEAFKKNDRVLILAPHPDDETIACAGIIQKALKGRAEVRVAYLTNGDHNEFAFIVYEKRITFRRTEFIHMGMVRRQEAIDAMRLLGLGQDKLTFLGYPDNGTFAIFSQYWQTGKPFRSFLTRISRVPYKTDLSFGSPYIGESILSDLKKVLLNYKPTKIFVSHPADVNLDHKALYLFLQIALRELRDRIPRAKVYAYLVHSLDWPKPRDYHPELNLKPPESFRNTQIEWSKLDLVPRALWLKYKAVLAYKSQTMVSAFYLLSFARKNELFGDYPEIQLKKQVSSKKRPPDFFGFSEMFTGARGGKEAPRANNPAGNHGEVSYAVVDKYFVIRVAKDKELIRRFSLALDIFGFNRRRPFASMPKIRIKARYEKFIVYDGARQVNPKNIRLHFNADDLILRIPLETLGNPDFILTSVRAYGGKPVLSDTGFRRIVIK
ncbi:MAG: PIG-L family deacetylase [Candidatus Omnitrophica bacterium]|nr:PIG-L family deacetylase [Candidatus Omnitrophota bacterium]